MILSGKLELIALKAINADVNTMVKVTVNIIKTSQDVVGEELSMIRQGYGMQLALLGFTKIGMSVYTTHVIVAKFHSGLEPEGL
jgi:hypothetical protein